MSMIIESGTINPAQAKLITRKPALEVLIDGRRLIGCVVSARASRGLDQSITTATVECLPNLPVWVRRWSGIRILMGESYSEMHTRFSGFVMNFSNSFYPGGKTLECVGVLALAERLYPPADFDAEMGSHTDEAAVTTALQLSGIPATMIGVIWGTGVPLGPTMESVVWAASSSALDFIHQVDQMSVLPDFSMYRTHEMTSGHVVRRRFDSDPSGGHTDYYFREGVNCFSGSSNLQITPAAAAVTVQGSGSARFTQNTGVVSSVSPRNVYTNYLITQSTIAQSAEHSAEAVARSLAVVDKQEMISCSITTPRNEIIQVGIVVHLVSRRLMVNQKFWVQSTSCEVDENGAFTQTLELVSWLKLDGNTANPGTQAPVPTVIDGEPFAPGDPISTPVSEFPEEPIEEEPPPDEENPGEGDDNIVIDIGILSVVKQRVLIADVPTDIWVVLAEDLSTIAGATVAERHWGTTEPAPEEE